MKVFLSGIHSWLRTGFKDLPFSLARFSSSSFLFFLNCAPNVSLCLHVLTTTRTYVPLPFSIFGSFYPNVRIFFYVKILVGDIEGGAKKKTTILVFFFVFFCWAQFFAPPSEWRPRRPPIPPVGKTAPEYTSGQLWVKRSWRGASRSSSDN